MAKYSNQEVIKRFFNHQCDIESHTGNLWVTQKGDRLMSYSTCLVERNAELQLMIFNRTSYSNSTSKIQDSIMSELWKRHTSSWIEENTIQIDNVYGGGTYGGGVSYLIQHAKEKIEWAKGIKPVKLINYFDVWGNKKDGWEVNNLCEETEYSNLEIHENATAKEAFQLLKDCGFFKKTARITQVDVLPLDDFGWEFYQRKDRKPICRLEFVHNYSQNTQEVK
jgi:hypothetical protein